MPFENPPFERVAALMRQARTIAVVGLSDNPQRPSYEVASVLRDYGYRIIPVNPALTVWEGLRAVPDLDHLGDVLGPGEQVDIVDVFRSAEFVDGIVEQCIRIKAPALWLQLGVVNESAAQRARDAGITVVMDRCLKIERRKLDK